MELLESEQADDIDVVLMDMRMPGMDGIETTKIIRTKNGKCMEVPIIAMTADGFETDIGMLQKAGMNGLISKPVDVNTLVEHITNRQVVNTLPVLRVYYLDSPIKKSATVPGPECVPIVGHI
ncbi:MAG: response regulator [Lachnospira eligens]